jgi:hypothetical protein
MPLALLVVAGEREGEVFPILEDRALTIGRDASNDIRLFDRKLSRIHCQVEIVGGQCQVTDLNSTNGTMVRGVRIESETPVSLGNEVEVGMTRLRLVEIRPADVARVERQRKARAAEEGHPEGALSCEECGAAISAEDIASGKARTVGGRHYCVNCSATFETAEAAPVPPAGPLPEARVERIRAVKELAGVRVISLGEGRLGPVFKAQQMSMGRLVSLKILDVSDADWTKKYLQAVYVSGQLVHSNVVLIFDTGRENDLFYVVREYVDGLSLQARLANHEPLPMPEACGILSQVLHALEHAAERQIIHGWLSPRRILLGPRESVKVSGFGLPLTPPPGRGAATYNWDALPYVAPERLRAKKPATLAGDLYSAVALLYHLLSSRPPFSGDAREEIEQRILNQPPKPLADIVPGIPQSAQKIMDRGLSKDPRGRYQSPGDLLSDIQKALRQSA